MAATFTAQNAAPSFLAGQEKIVVKARAAPIASRASVQVSAAATSSGDGLSGLQVRSVNFYDKGGTSCSAFEAQPRARLCKQCQLLRGYDLQMRAIKQYNNATVLLALRLRPITLRVSEAGTPTTDLRLCGWAIADELTDFIVVVLFSFVGGGGG